MVGSDVDSGSDPEMEDELVDADSGGNASNQWKVVEPRKRKKSWGQISETDSEVGNHQARRRKEEFKVLLKFATESGNSINPLKLTKTLKEIVGTTECIKTLRDGKLMLFCKDGRQQKTAMGIKTLIGHKVVCSIPEEKSWVRGVISGIPTDVSSEKIKRNITGAAVNDVRRLKCIRNNEKIDSLSVVLNFDENKLPERVYLGFVSYAVRPYVPPPLRCYKCQKFGHVAAVCRGKQRCARCGGDHEYGKCGQGIKPKCCNCGGEHSAGYAGCLVRKNAVKVQNVRVAEGISYAEALKKVKQTPKVLETRTTEPQQKTKLKEQSKENKVSVDKVSFVTFIAEVVNCSAQTESRTERIKIIIRAAEKYLELEDVTVDMINDRLKMQTVNSQTVNSQTCGGT